MSVLAEANRPGTSLDTNKEMITFFDPSTEKISRTTEREAPENQQNNKESSESETKTGKPVLSAKVVNKSGKSPEETALLMQRLMGSTRSRLLLNQLLGGLAKHQPAQHHDTPNKRQKIHQ